MPHYAIRVTHSYDVMQRVVAAWAMKCSKMVVYEHIGGKTEKIHIHLAIYNTNVSKKQLRNIGIGLGLQLKGNEWMSCKEWDGMPADYCHYMTKGQLDPSYVLGYSQEETDDWKSKFVPHSEYVKETTWTKLYKDFAPTCPIKPFDGPEWIDSKSTYSPREMHSNENFPKIDRAARKFVKNIFPVWCPAWSSYLQCCVRTHCWNNGITIPKDWNSK